MAGIPLRFIPVGIQLGDDEGAESMSISSVFSVGGSKNLTFDKLARVSSILGWSKRNAAAVTSNAGAAAMLLRAIIHYTRQLAGATVRQELGFFDDGVNHFEARLSVDTGQTWAFVRDFGVGSPGRIPSFVALGNQGVLVNGYIPAYGWDGAALTEIRSTQLAAPVITNAGVGQLNGVFRWKVVVRKADGTRKAASVWSARTVLALRKATVTWLADVDAAAYEVYRTTATGDIGLFLGAVPAGTLTFNDNVGDLDLINGRMLQEYGDIPPVGAYHVFVHKSRVFYLRTDAAPRTGFYSDPGLPFSVHADASFIDCTDAESFSDVATGGTGNFENMAVIWLERSVWTISGTGDPSGILIDFQRRRSTARVGTVHVNTVARVSKGAIYLDAQGGQQIIPQSMLAYLTPFGDLRAFDGKYDTIIGHGKADTFKRLNYAQRHKSFVAIDTPRNELTWVFPIDDSIEPNIGVTWNTKYGTMTERAWPFACVREIETGDDSSVLLAGESSTVTGGFCYLLWDGHTKADGSAISSQFMSKTLYGLGNTYSKSGMADVPLLQFDKRWRWIDVMIKASGDITFRLEWWPGEAEPEDSSFGTKTVTLPHSALYTADGSPIKDADGNQIYAINNKPVLRFKLKNTTDHFLHSRGMRFRLSSTTTTADWSMVGFVVAYQLLKGLRREFRR